MLLCNLKELGTLNCNQISALAGTAPINNDSGTFSGKRRVRGGRRDIRHKLFMPVLGAATQHNVRLNSFYRKLIALGKPKKVALIACIRKLVVWANAILKSGQAWQETSSELA